VSENHEITEDCSGVKFTDLNQIHTISEYDYGLLKGNNSMKFQHLTAFCILILSVGGCNDVSTNRKMGTAQPPQAVTADSLIVSGIHREQGKPAVSYADEIKADGKPANTRFIPDNRLDDDGADGENATFALRPSVECGLGRSVSLINKIKDCVDKNADRAFWSGKVNGSSAETDWKLVMLSIVGTTKTEIWYDTRTKMLWSDIVSTTANWCKASGSDQPSSDLVSIECNNLIGNERTCVNYSHAEMPNVHWRLPSRVDYLQADIDGIRFVLRRSADTFWTATTSTFKLGEKRENAWTYDLETGNFVAVKMSEARSVRCIGTSNF